MGTFGQELIFALRMMRKNLGFGFRRIVISDLRRLLLARSDIAAISRLIAFSCQACRPVDPVPWPLSYLFFQPLTELVV